MAPILLDGARDLGAPGFFAHMDPPTPWITWAVSQWTASRNQNLLHPDTAPTARHTRRDGDRMVRSVLRHERGPHDRRLDAGQHHRSVGGPGSRSGRGGRRCGRPSERHERQRTFWACRSAVDWDEPGDLTRTAAVITAGMTSTGEIEPLDAADDAWWRHVDAAWSGPLRLSDRYAGLLEGRRARRQRVPVGPQVAVPAQGVGAGPFRRCRTRPPIGERRWTLSLRAERGRPRLARCCGSAIGCDRSRLRAGRDRRVDRSHDGVGRPAPRPRRGPSSAGSSQRNPGPAF